MKHLLDIRDGKGRRWPQLEWRVGPVGNARAGGVAEALQQLFAHILRGHAMAEVSGAVAPTASGVRVKP